MTIIRLEDPVSRTAPLAVMTATSHDYQICVAPRMLDAGIALTT